MLYKLAAMKVVLVSLLFFSFCQAKYLDPQPVPVGMNSTEKEKETRPEKNEIVGGDFAYFSSFPYIVSISLPGGRLCGGSIIGPKWVVTAAHCVVKSNNPRAIWVFAGKTFLSDRSNPLAVQSIFVHEQYKVPSNLFFPNDIALLKLKDPFPPGTRNVLLPQCSDNFDGQTCKAAGWGKYNNEEWTGASNQLKYANMTVQTPANCYNDFHRGVDARYHVCVKDVAFGVSSTCNGDSGGPLVCNNVLVGITSFGFSGCDAYRSRVDTRVSSYVDWIYNKMNTYGYS